MSLGHGASVVRDGLVVDLDATNVKSYPGSGTTWYDLSGNGNNGTLSGYTHTSDFSSSYFVFSGSGSAVVSSFSKSIGNQMTMEIVYMSSVTDTFSEFGRIVDRGDTTISLGTQASYQLRMWTFAGGSRSAESQVNGIGQDGSWHHLIYTYNGSNTSLYLDGVYQNGYAKTGNLENPASITIGNGDGNLFNGRIALFRYYENGFTLSQVKQNFNAMRGRFGL
jgi:hypothetical protein